MARISSLLLVRCSISFESLIFMRKKLSYERKQPSITDLTARARNNHSCVLGMKISDSDNVFMAESSILWVVLNDSTNALCAWELLMGFQVWITRLDTPPGINS